ncbi:hypothetical protein OG989_07780 [Micromonospora sp. NBC_01740]|uniref:hypothetical protein n=1 Tax=Micromonospora sp. NBC_01740 TaxID=2975986 RepID=UPI002E10BC3F|nr:hypothetical protein OG989_07780 [Micromonospora sp. NBC_01740]
MVGSGSTVALAVGPSGAGDALGAGDAVGSGGGSERVLVGSTDVGSPVGVGAGLALGLGEGFGDGLGNAGGLGDEGAEGLGDEGGGTGRPPGRDGGFGRAAGPSGGGGAGAATIGVRGKGTTVRQSPGSATAGDGVDGATGGRPVAGTGITTGPTEGVGRNGVLPSGRAVLPTVAEPVLIAARMGIDAVPASSATVNR